MLGRLRPPPALIPLEIMIHGARRTPLGAVLSAVLLCSSPASAQVPELPEAIVRDEHGVATVRTLRTPSPIIVDGHLEEAIYRDVKPFGEFVQQEPFEGKPATEKTEIWVFFDDKNVYVSARLWETEPERRVTSDMRRDANNMYNNDHLAVLFDTFNDRRNAFGFSSNAQGGMFDWQVTNEQPSNNWNAPGNVRAANFDGGWTIEFVIPFRSMRFKEGATSWGINFRAHGAVAERGVLSVAGAAVVGPAGPVEGVVHRPDGRHRTTRQAPESGHQALRARRRHQQQAGDAGDRQRPGGGVRRGREVGHHPVPVRGLHLQHRLRAGRRRRSSR